MLDRLPRLRIGFAHGGGSFPGTIGRIDHGFRARPDLCQTETRTPPRERLRSGIGSGVGVGGRPAGFYVDALVHDAGALGVIMDLIGPERIMLGSDYPFPLGEERPGELILSMKMDEKDRERMLRSTALEFLGGAGKRLGEKVNA
jgi:aminocarboxymuconate-semialdehyde decarboxylase